MGDYSAFFLTQDPADVNPMYASDLHLCRPESEMAGDNQIWATNDGRIVFTAPGEEPPAGSRRPTPGEMDQVRQLRGSGHQFCLGAPEAGASLPTDADTPYSGAVTIYSGYGRNQHPLNDRVCNENQMLNPNTIQPLDFTFQSDAEALNFLASGNFAQGQYCVEPGTAEGPTRQIRIQAPAMQVRRTLMEITGLERNQVLMDVDPETFPNQSPFFAEDRLAVLYQSASNMIEPLLEQQALRIEQRESTDENRIFRESMDKKQDKMMWIMIGLGAATVVSTYVAARGAGLTRRFDSFIGNLTRAVRETPGRAWASDWTGLSRRWRGVFGESSPIMRDFTDRVRGLNNPLTPTGRKILEGFDRGARPHVILGGPSGSSKGYSANTAAGEAVRGDSGVEAFEGRQVRYVRISASRIVQEAGSWQNRAEELFFKTLDGLAGKNPVIVHLTEADAFAEAGTGPGNQALNLLKKMYEILEGNDPRYENLHFLFDSTRWEVIEQAAPDLLRRTEFVETRPMLPQEIRTVMDVGIQGRLNGDEGRVLRGRYQRANLQPQALDAITALGAFERGAPPSSHLTLMDNVVTEITRANRGTTGTVEITEADVINSVARRTGRTPGQVEAELRGLLEGGIENNTRIQERIVEGFYRAYPNPKDGHINPLDPTASTDGAEAADGADPAEAPDARDAADRGTERARSYRNIARPIEDAHDVRISSRTIEQAIEWIDRDGISNREADALIRTLFERAASEAAAGGQEVVSVERFERTYESWRTADGLFAVEHGERWATMDVASLAPEVWRFAEALEAHQSSEGRTLDAAGREAFFTNWQAEQAGGDGAAQVRPADAPGDGSNGTSRGNGAGRSNGADGSNGASPVRTGLEEIDFSREIPWDSVREGMRAQGMEFDSDFETNHRTVGELIRDLGPRQALRVYTQVEADHPTLTGDAFQRAFTSELIIQSAERRGLTTDARGRARLASNLPSRLERGEGGRGRDGHPDGRGREGEGREGREGARRPRPRFVAP